MNFFSVEEAAQILRMSREALSKRLVRAPKKESADGVEARLGHGVVAFKFQFNKEWTILIPKRVINMIKRTKGKRS